MRTVSVHTAKANLSQLIGEVAAGEEIVIARAGKPIAKLAAFTPSRPKRQLGLLAGRIRIPADFDAPLPKDVLDSVEGR